MVQDNIKISYSVVIRTLGNSGEKYQRLLMSIQKQIIQPEEIIVVIPKGYTLDFEIGIERIIYSEKGMIVQRAMGIDAAQSDYILVVDDDIEFNSNFIVELHNFLMKHQLDCVLPMEGVAKEGAAKMEYHYSIMQRIRGAFTGQIFISNKQSKYLDVITKTAGHKIYTSCCKLDECYYCQSGNFQCFYINRKIAQSAKFMDEVWLQEGTITSYASYDDPTFFYKLYLQGMKMAYALRTRYVHLDASAGRKTITLLQSKIIRYYSVARNRSIFWYKFLWLPQHSFFQKLKVLFGGIYGSFNYTVYNLIINLHPRYWSALKAMWVGYKDAYKYIREFKQKNKGV